VWLAAFGCRMITLWGNCLSPGPAKTSFKRSDASDGPAASGRGSKGVSPPGCLWVLSGPPQPAIPNGGSAMGYAAFVVLSLIIVLGLLAAATGRHRGGESPGPAPSAGGDSAEGGPAGNHLAGQTSLYLKMHVHNPVDWYPWGEEALAKAQAERKLIFLSIGYSSCYWCHVMERESFMDEEVAQALNEQFVAIKVDREERPDIDEIYMTALQLYFQLIRSPRSG
jgi:hypothetical protein